MLGGRQSIAGHPAAVGEVSRGVGLKVVKADEVGGCTAPADLKRSPLPPGRAAAGCMLGLVAIGQGVVALNLWEAFELSCLVDEHDQAGDACRRQSMGPQDQRLHTAVTDRVQ